MSSNSRRSSSTVSFGQSVYDLTIGVDDALVVLSGGTASNTSLKGTEVVSAGGSDVGARIYAGGKQQVYGTASAVSVSSGGTQVVSKGGVASHTIVSSGGTMSVTAGGSAVSTVIVVGGSEIVHDQGRDTGALVAGLQLVRGTATGAEVVSGGTQAVSNGGTATNTVVDAGGTQAVSAGGSAGGTLVGSGGLQTVAAGGVVSAAKVMGGGAQVVSNGGLAAGSVLSGANDANPPSPGGLHIVFSYLGGVPAAAQAALQVAAQFFENMFVFAAPVTINLTISWGEVDGIPLSLGVLGKTDVFFDTRLTVPFSSLVQALHLSGAQLPASDPSNGVGFAVPRVEAKILGLLAGASASNDGNIGFADTATWDYAQQGVPGAVDFVAVAEHEITHAMGRVDLGFVGLGIQGRAFGPTPYDLFRYAAPGVLASPYSFSSPSYFSLDGGITNLVNIDPGSPSHFGDRTRDQYDTGTAIGTTEPTTLTDIGLMDALFGGVPLNLAKETISGGTASTTVVSAGGLLTVGWGGVASGATVLSGGFEAVSAGGRSLGSIVSNGGQMNVYSGGLDSDTSLWGTADETVYAGGTATGTHVTNGVAVTATDMSALREGASLAFPSQLYVYGTTVSSVLTEQVTGNGDTLLGIETVLSGGVASATIVSGGLLDVRFGGSETGTTILAGGVDQLEGSASNVTVRAGGILLVIQSGVASGTVVSSGGTVSASPNSFRGILLGTTISSGGKAIVGANGMAGATAIGSGGRQVIAGGVASGTVVNGGGTETLNESNALGGTAIHTTVSSGGTQNVGSLSVASSTQLTGGAQFVLSGGTGLGTIIGTGGRQTVTDGGYADGTIIFDKGQQIVADTAPGVPGPNLVRNGGFEASLNRPSFWTRNNNGIRATTPGTFGLQAHSGQTFVALFGTPGLLSQSIADTAGVRYTLSYWLASDGLTPSHFEADWNGMALAASVKDDAPASGYQRYSFTVTGTGQDTLTFAVNDPLGALALDDVSLNAGALGALATRTVVGSGGMQTVMDGGTASGTVVSSGGIQTLSRGVIDGGTASDTIVLGSGTQNIGPSSVASSTLLEGGTQIVSSGGTAVSTTVGANIIRNGGFETGNFAGWTLNAAAFSEFVGTEQAFGSPAHSGQNVAVLGNYNGTGTLSQTVDDTPGAQYTLSYWLSGDGLASNSFEADWNGVALAGSVLNNGAAFGYRQFVFTVTGTGHDTLTFVQEDDNGQWALDDVSLGSGTGGVQNVLSGGLASGTTISGGGSEIVSSGGVIAGATITGGTLEVQQGGTVTGTVQLIGSGSVLQIDGPVAPSQTVLPGATLSNLDGSGVIDLRSIAFDSGSTATANAAGTQLSVSAKGQTYLFTFDGSIAGHLFNVASDGHGGSLITDPVPAGPAVVSAAADSVPGTVSAPHTIATGATLELSDAYAGKITFLGPTSTLLLDNSTTFAGVVSGMGGGDVIDLRDIGWAEAALRYAGDSGSGDLSINGGARSADFKLLGSYSVADFTLSSDGHGGTLIAASRLGQT